MLRVQVLDVGWVNYKKSRPDFFEVVKQQAAAAGFVYHAPAKRTGEVKKLASLAESFLARAQRSGPTFTIVFLAPTTRDVARRHDALNRVCASRAHQAFCSLLVLSEIPPDPEAVVRSLLEHWASIADGTSLVSVDLQRPSPRTNHQE